MDSKKVADDFGIILGEDDDSKKQQADNIIEHFEYDTIDPDIEKNASGKPSVRPISKGMMISEIINEHPEIIPKIMDKGMHCVGCGANMFETLEEGFMMHGMDHEEIDRIVEELNDEIAQKPKRGQPSEDTDEFFS